MVYSREVEGRTLDFVHPGILWRDALVLEDRQTGSLWAQGLGEAIHGPMTGTRLERYPSEITSWESWSSRHPDTLVLPAEKSRRKLKMRLYERSDSLLGILGSENPDERLPGKTLVAGLEVGEQRVAVILPTDGKEYEARFTVGSEHFVVRHRGGDGPTRGWSSLGPPSWDVVEPAAIRVMYWFAWAGLYPDTAIVESRPIGVP